MDMARARYQDELAAAHAALGAPQPVAA
jgi:hypothetical protein